MSFGDFDLAKVRADFGLTLDNTQSLFSHILPTPLSPILAGFLGMAQPLGMALTTEKGRSELMVMPMFVEVWNRCDRKIAVFSGSEFNVDMSIGLNGACDYLLCRAPQQFYVEAPVLVAVEAKRDFIPNGLGQCAATMIAVQRFNKRANAPVDAVFGCVTTGTNWRFLRLTGNRLDIDEDEYQFKQADHILGILLHCCGVPPTP